MFVQVKNDRIVCVSETPTTNSIEVELPSDFDFDYIDHYEYKDGVVTKRASPVVEQQPTQEERIVQLEEALELLLSGAVE